jgi:large repetitive protein
LDDALNDRYHTWDLAHTSSSTDSSFNAQTIPVIRAHVMAADVPQILLYESNGTTVLSEGGSIDDYFLGLSHAPTADVTVTVTTDAQMEAGLVAAYGQMQTYSSNFTVTFTPTDWMVKRLLMRAVDDLNAEATPHNGFLSHSATSADARYNGITIAGIPSFITDNDYPAVRVIASGGTTVLSEGGVRIPTTYISPASLPLMLPSPSIQELRSRPPLAPPSSSRTRTGIYLRRSRSPP